MAGKKQQCRCSGTVAHESAVPTGLGAIVGPVNWADVALRRYTTADLAVGVEGESVEFSPRGRGPDSTMMSVPWDDLGEVSHKVSKYDTTHGVYQTPLTRCLNDSTDEYTASDCYEMYGEKTTTSGRGCATYFSPPSYNRARRAGGAVALAARQNNNVLIKRMAFPAAEINYPPVSRVDRKVTSTSGGSTSLTDCLNNTTDEYTAADCYEMYGTTTGSGSSSTPSTTACTMVGTSKQCTTPCISPVASGEIDGLDTDGASGAVYVHPGWYHDTTDNERELIIAAWAMIRDNWDIVTWVWCLVFGEGDAGLAVLEDNLFPWIPGLSVIPVILEGDSGFLGIATHCGSVADVTAWSSMGEIRLCADSSEWANMLLLWGSSSDSDRVFVVIALAYTLMHELTHVADKAHGDVPNQCYESYRLANSLVWALFQRYPRSQSSSCYGRLLASYSNDLNKLFNADEDNFPSSC